MTRPVIWKFPLAFAGMNGSRATAQIPTGARILKVQLMDCGICLWAQVQPDNPLELRTFQIIGTGQPIDFLGESHRISPPAALAAMVYLDTLFDVTTDPGTGKPFTFVWHLFDVTDIVGPPIPTLEPSEPSSV